MVGFGGVRSISKGLRWNRIVAWVSRTFGVGFVAMVGSRTIILRSEEIIKLLLDDFILSGR